MKKIIKKTPWVYMVHVSKDSPQNINRGFFDGLPDTEYYRGYFHPVTYTEKREAEHALSYFEKGYIEKHRYVMVDLDYGRGTSDRTESAIIKRL
jgi:hypothetical protein